MPKFGRCLEAHNGDIVISLPYPDLKVKEKVNSTIKVTATTKEAIKIISNVTQHDQGLLVQAALALYVDVWNAEHEANKIPIQIKK